MCSTRFHFFFLAKFRLASIMIAHGENNQVHTSIASVGHVMRTKLYEHPNINDGYITYLPWLGNFKCGPCYEDLDYDVALLF